MRRLNSSRTALRGATATVAAGGVATVLSGCFYLNPPETDNAYNPADGAISKVGDVELTNVLVVAAKKGEEGKLEGLATNRGKSAAKLTITPTGGSPTEVTVPAGTSVRLDGQEMGSDSKTVDAVTIDNVPVEPGSRMQIEFSASGAGKTPVSIPVLLDQYPYGSASPEHATAEAQEGAEGGHH